MFILKLLSTLCVSLILRKSDQRYSCFVGLSFRLSIAFVLPYWSPILFFIFVQFLHFQSCCRIPLRNCIFSFCPQQALQTSSVKTALSQEINELKIVKLDLENQVQGLNHLFTYHWKLKCTQDNEKNGVNIEKGFKKFLRPTSRFSGSNVEWESGGVGASPSIGFSSSFPAAILHSSSILATAAVA